MPSSTFGNIFDVLVDRSAKRHAIFNYPVVWAAGDVVLDGPWHETLRDYVTRGGTLVVNVEAARKLPETLLGVKLAANTTISETWSTDGASWRSTTPFEVAHATNSTAKPLAWASEDKKLPLVTQHQIGEGKVILSLVPHMLGLDERAHEALPLMMNGVTSGLLPVDVQLSDGSRPQGEILYQLNRTKDGYLVLLANNRGIDKTQHGVARVDRRAVADIVVRTSLPIKSAHEYSTDREVKLERSGRQQVARLRVHPGDVQVLYLVTQ